MKTAKIFPRRRSVLITRLEALPSDEDRVMTLRIHVSTAELCRRLRDRLRIPRGSARVRAAMTALIQPPAGDRKRLGELQPQIPERLREALRVKAQAIGPRRSNALVVRGLDPWIRFAAMRRKTRSTKESGGKVLRPPANIGEFRKRGRELMDERSLVRFTVNAGTGIKKRAIEKLAASLGMNLSEFFSALIERLCNEG